MAVRLLVATALSGLAFVVPARAEDGAQPVKVNFSAPERYIDAGLYSEYGAKSRAATMDALRGHFEHLGKKYLPAGRTLEIDVTDIDLAGEYEPWRIDAHDVRFMRDATPPRISLRYTLRQPGAPDATGEDVVRDLDYLNRLGRQTSNDTLFYEKEMLDDWFRSRFATRQRPRG